MFRSCIIYLCLVFLKSRKRRNCRAGREKKTIIVGQPLTVYLSLLLLGVQGSNAFYHHFFTRAGEFVDVIYRQLFSLPSALSPFAYLLHLLVHLSSDRKLGLIIGIIPPSSSSFIFFNFKYVYCGVCVCARVVHKEVCNEMVYAAYIHFKMLYRK